MVESIAISEFIDAIKTEQKETQSTLAAIVSRIDNEGVVWVNVAGAEKETPTALSSADVKRGDVVNVEWRNNKLYIAGNTSNPAAGVIRVNAVEQAAQVANDAANNAVADASRARDAAETAQNFAADAAEAGRTAWEYADQANTNALSAGKSAEDAQTSANDAYLYANKAIYELGNIEDVVNVLNWIATHGEYALTEDTSVIDGKWYFELIDGEYQVVSPSAGSDPSALGYYELSSIKESVSNYLMTHIALDSRGLWVQMSESTAKLQISATGITLWDKDGNAIARYTDTVTLGNEEGSHVTLSSGELGFWNGATKVAYIKAETGMSKLYITESEITDTLRIGNFIWVVQGDNRISLRYSEKQ